MTIALSFATRRLCYNGHSASREDRRDAAEDISMTIEITIEVPDTLGHQLQQMQDRLPEVLERGLREIAAEASEIPHDEQSIIAVLTSQPTPEQVLAIRPSPALQDRMRELQELGKHGTLTTQERAELDRALLLEHMVRLAKANAYRRLAPQP